MADARGTPHRWPGTANRILTVLAIAGAVLSVALFLRRGMAVWSAAAIAPGVIVSSGCEQESQFAVWRAIRDQPVYVDSHRQPYAAAYFNWLFYHGYAPLLRRVTATQGDSALPRYGRLITAAGGVAGALAFAWLLFRLDDRRLIFAAAVAGYVYFGPLIGWWAHTVRPDVWALACETGAVVVLLAAGRARPWRAVLASTLLFFAAWSFKQTFVCGLGAAVLFLVARRRWRMAAGLVTGSVALWTGTLLTLGANYRYALFHVTPYDIFSLRIGLDNLVLALAKAAPLVVLAAAAFREGWRNSPNVPLTPLAADARLLGGIGILVSGPLAFLASCKFGAWVNYYFTFSLMLALYGSAWPPPRQRKLGAAAATVSLALVLQGLALVGAVGVIDLTPQARTLAVRWEVWRHLPEPRFSHDTRLNLPWLNKGSPAFVLAFNYGLERMARTRYEGGGLGGLIEAGYFSALLLPAETTGEYDGGSLRRYVRGQTVEGMTAFVRTESVTPPNR
ncbi:MAG: hypothetical protein PHQ04_07270 [Opitutaceae bacterium]|nr:hypothetical protein [Opitutaceae bacterium]